MNGNAVKLGACIVALAALLSGCSGGHEETQSGAGAFSGEEAPSDGHEEPNAPPSTGSPEEAPNPPDDSTAKRVCFVKELPVSTPPTSLDTTVGDGYLLRGYRCTDGKWVSTAKRACFMEDLPSSAAPPGTEPVPDGSIVQGFRCAQGEWVIAR
jgi:hypothetical protein